MNELKEYLKRELGITDEQYLQLVEIERGKSVTRQDLNNLGDTLIVTLQNDNQLGDLVMSLLMEIESLKTRVTTLEGGTTNA